MCGSDCVCKQILNNKGLTRTRTHCIISIALVLYKSICCSVLAANLYNYSLVCTNTKI